MNGREWGTRELRVLRSCSGLGVDRMAILLGRSRKAVQRYAEREGVSLRDTGEDVTVTADALALMDANPAAAALVCPLCHARFHRMRSGMCRRCHLEALLELADDEQAEQERLRRLNKARQDKRRLRLCDTCGRPFHPRPTSPETSCEACRGRENSQEMNGDS